MDPHDPMPLVYPSHERTRAVAAMRLLFLSWHLPDDSMQFAGHVDDIDEDQPTGIAG
jgi:hypothetical protein